MKSIDVFPGEAGVIEGLCGASGLDLERAYALPDNAQGVFVDSDDGSFTPLWHEKFSLVSESAGLFSFRWGE